MPETMSYRQLRQFLLDLGFEEKSVKDSHVVFRHRESDTVILLPDYKPREPVWLPNVVGVRRMLIDKGLVAAENFDQFVANGRPLHSPTKSS